MSSPTIHRAVIKQILSGDCIVVRGKPQGGPPPERTIAFSNLTAPRLARKAGETDEPFAWESREFLRTRLVGREIFFIVDGKNPQGKEYATVYRQVQAQTPLRLPTSVQDLQESGDFENLNELIVSAGLVEVRRLTSGAALAAAGEQYRRLLALEESSKAAHKGRWCEEGSQSPLAVRHVEWSVPDQRHFVDSMRQKQLAGIVEHVRDGCTYRVILLPEEGAVKPIFYTFMFILSGLRTPTFKQENDEQVAEEFAEEARFFAESRILQRQVNILLESVSGQSLVGSMLHPKGNIAHLLLQEGLARCVDWSMAVVSAPGGAEAMRQAERQAKEKRLRLWRNWQSSNGMGVSNPAPVPGIGGANPPASACPIHGKVIEVGNGDNLMVKRAKDGVLQRFFLASVRPPRPAAPASAGAPAARSRPLYDVPYMFEAREFLRKKLIGKKVTVLVDYVQAPLQEGQEERVCATVLLGEDVNVAEALVSKGLATVVKYRPDEEKRSRAYDLLLAAEAVAQKKMVGLHSKKEPPTHRVADLMGDVNKSRQFLPFLKRGGRLEAIVEYVASGSRFRAYIPKETCIITFLCSGIECPRPARRMPNGKEEAGDPMGQEALDFARETVMQREVDLEVETMDKGGNFVGWMFYTHPSVATPDTGASAHHSSNLSVNLVEMGLAKVHFTAERSPYFQALQNAEEKASAAKLGLWALDQQKLAWGANKDDATGDDAQQTKTKTLTKKSRGMLVHVKQEGLKFFVQLSDSAAKLKKIASEAAQYTEEHPPVPGSYTPRTGEVCMAQFSQDLNWYRAKILKVVAGGKEARVVFIDYGNEEVVKPVSTRMIALPPGLSVASIPPQAREYRLAGVQVPPEEEDQKVVWEMLEHDLLYKEVDITPEYEDAVSLTMLADGTDTSKEGVDIGELMLRQGLVSMEKTRELRGELREKYEAAQAEAKKQRRHIWCYGDFTADD